MAQPTTDRLVELVDSVLTLEGPFAMTVTVTLEPSGDGRWRWAVTYGDHLLSAVEAGPTAATKAACTAIHKAVVRTMGSALRPKPDPTEATQ